MRNIKAVVEKCGRYRLSVVDSQVNKNFQLVTRIGIKTTAFGTSHNIENYGSGKTIIQVFCFFFTKMRTVSF